jgi:hypothetical protein
MRDRRVATLRACEQNHLCPKATRRQARVTVRDTSESYRQIECAQRGSSTFEKPVSSPRMKPHGKYKLSYRANTPASTDLALLSRGFVGFGRCQRIVDSLRSQILEGGPDQCLRIRQIFQSPREIYRVEIQEPELHYFRTTLLDGDALEDLLETEEVRERVIDIAGSGVSAED